MARAKTKDPEDDAANAHMLMRLREGGLIGLVALCLYLSLALVSFDPADPGWSYTGSDEAVANLVGVSGAWIADVLFFIFGYWAFVFPLLLACQAWLLFRDRKRPLAFSWTILGFRSFGFLLTISAGAGLAALHFYTSG
ncbi:MAG: DNA translocase FtsK 4TM domain-containing protein, partial [Pseudomonadales bacterium]|nr:DNA translocase FtsK 4TM domain-containing protein [Pseudomonadales bacterium]